MQDHAVWQVTLDRDALKIGILLDEAFLPAQAVAEEQVVPLLDTERVEHILRLIARQSYDLHTVHAEKCRQRKDAAD